jgi:hypothetical protein
MLIEFSDVILLLGAAFIAGALNAVAGGGSCKRPVLAALALDLPRIGNGCMDGQV